MFQKAPTTGKLFISIIFQSMTLICYGAKGEFEVNIYKKKAYEFCRKTNTIDCTIKLKHCQAWQNNAYRFLFNYINIFLILDFKSSRSAILVLWAFLNALMVRGWARVRIVNRGVQFTLTLK
jgi:hypothetical protein